jgi:hypothetical protein
MKDFVQAIVWPAVFSVGLHVGAVIMAIAGASVTSVAAVSVAGVTSAVLATRSR